MNALTDASINAFIDRGAKIKSLNIRAHSSNDDSLKISLQNYYEFYFESISIINLIFFLTNKIRCFN